MTTSAAAPTALRWVQSRCGNISEADLLGHTLTVTAEDDGFWLLGSDLGYQRLFVVTREDAEREAEAVIRRGLLRMIAMLR